MKVEELLAMLQEKGLSDDEIKALLGEAMKTLEGDFEKHDEDVAKEEDAERAEAGKLLGVTL